ncbi:MAG: efflux RND transporter periplasmic adaptor subunit [Deltaproteobacteria bacterium]|nr:efflux RND transporter periplasmic adaptor subunit [Deltaproteobacteria bacterium]
MTSDKKHNSDTHKLLAIAGAAVILIFCASAGLVLARQQRIQRQTRELEQVAERGPHVLVMQLKADASERMADLPASVHGYVETPVYAKIPGYMKTINVDKGDRVKAGQVIAVIQSPETDKQVADARSYYWLQAVTDRRYQQLVRQQVIPQQTADNSHASMLQAWDAYQQEVALQSYELVRAPFDGIVTARYADPGTLIPQSTTSSSANAPIVSLAMLTPLRVYAYAPQSLSPYIKDGDRAAVTVSEFTGRQFSGTITRHPEALDQNTRTMLVEVDLPNTDRSLYPGMYADMHLTARVTASSISAPDDALVFRNNKVYLPIVRGDRLSLIAVNLGRDDGYTVEVSGDGLHAGDLVAMNVGEAAHDGEAVQPVEPNQQSM